MEISFVVKVAGVGLVVAVLNVLLTQAGKEEYAQMAAIAGVVIAFFMLIPKVQSLIALTRAAFGI